jgi:hypothetical protein
MPMATLGVLSAVGVVSGHVSRKFRSSGHRHGVRYTPTATLGVQPAVGVFPVYTDGHPQRTASCRRIPYVVYYLITLMYCIYTYF